jgi:hypothetical protein
MILWFMRRVYLNDSTLFLNFCHYPLLKRTWTFISINVDSLHAKIVSTKFDWNWPDVSFWKIFFQYTRKNCFPSCGPSWPLGTIICTSLNLHYMSGIFHVNVSYFDSVALEENICYWPQPIFAFLWLSPLWSEEDLVLYLKNIDFTLPKDDLY